MTVSRKVTADTLFGEIMRSHKAEEIHTAGAHTLLRVLGILHSGQLEVTDEYTDTNGNTTITTRDIKAGTLIQKVPADTIGDQHYEVIDGETGVAYNVPYYPDLDAISPQDITAIRCAVRIAGRMLEECDIQLTHFIEMYRANERAAHGE